MSRKPRDPLSLEFERIFLLRTAAWMLLCRYQNHNQLTRIVASVAADAIGSMIGELDCMAELRLLASDEKRRLLTRCSRRPRRSIIPDEWRVYQL